MDKVLEITSNDHIIMVDKLCKRIIGHPEILGRIIKGLVLRQEKVPSFSKKDIMKKYKFKEIEKAIEEYIKYYNEKKINVKRKGLSPLAYRQQSLS